MSAVYFKAKDNFTATTTSLETGTLLDMIIYFGIKSEYTLEIRHPANPDKVFRYVITDSSKEDIRQDRVV